MIDSRVTDICFREAIAADCVAVAEVHLRSWRESYAGIVPQTFLDKMSVENQAKAFETRFRDDSYKMYIAELPERGVVGFADFGQPRESIGAYEAELYAIYILPKFQGKGVGEKLFNLVLESLVRNGKSSMYLLALAVSPYKSFYEKMGGLIVGRKQIEIEGIVFETLVYGWESLLRRQAG